MADNYLEEQYDRYLSKKAAWEQARKTGKKSVASSSNHHPMNMPSKSQKNFEHQFDEEIDKEEE